MIDFKRDFEEYINKKGLSYADVADKTGMNPNNLYRFFKTDSKVNSKTKKKILNGFPNFQTELDIEVLEGQVIKNFYLLKDRPKIRELIKKYHIY